MMASLLAAAFAVAPAAPTGCADVPGADSLWQPATRWVFIGELHGTNETPDAFANLVCLAAKARQSVTVALEYPVDAQPVIDAWLASDGSDRARAALLALPAWQRKIQDGRTSAAFLRLFEQLRVLRHAGKVASVRAFDAPSDNSDKRDRNAAMADRLKHIADETSGLVLVLVGNIHAMRVPLVRPAMTIYPAASLLPDGARMSVNVDGDGGAVWNCRLEGCHVYDDGPGPAHRAGIIFDTAPDRRFDATYQLGKPFTAALPAVPGVADTSPLTSAVMKP